MTILSARVPMGIATEFDRLYEESLARWEAEFGEAFCFQCTESGYQVVIRGELVPVALGLGEMFDPASAIERVRKAVPA